MFDLFIRWPRWNRFSIRYSSDAVYWAIKSLKTNWKKSASLRNHSWSLCPRSKTILLREISNTARSIFTEHIKLLIKTYVHNKHYSYSILTPPSSRHNLQCILKCQFIHWKCEQQSLINFSLINAIR